MSRANKFSAALEDRVDGGTRPDMKFMHSNVEPVSRIQRLCRACILFFFFLLLFYFYEFPREISRGGCSGRAEKKGGHTDASCFAFLTKQKIPQRLVKISSGPLVYFPSAFIPFLTIFLSLFLFFKYLFSLFGSS